MTKFTFFERVRIRTSDPAKTHLNGELGTVLGIAETEPGAEGYYAVSLDARRQNWCFRESELRSTGEFANPEEYYDGSTVRVRVDERGRGTVVPRPENS